MRFAFIHKLSSYLMVTSSFCALYFSGEIAAHFSVLFVVAAPLSWFWDSPRVDSRRYNVAWNIVTVLVLLYLATELLLVGGGDPMSLGIHFLIFILVNKLFNRRQSRDYLQMYVISFLMLVASAALNTDVTFAIFFLLYIVFTTWTLILFHLKREMEDNYLLKHKGEKGGSEKIQVDRIFNSRRIVGGAFLVSTSMISLAVFVLSSAIFLLFPRLGFGLFISKSRGGITMAGFSDRIELGQFGTIQDNSQIVMRVEIPALEAIKPLNFRWRGVSLDHYEKKVWSRKARVKNSDSRQAQGTVVLDRARPDLSRLLKMTIYLDALNTDAVFHPGQLKAMEFPTRIVEDVLGRNRIVVRDDHGDLAMTRQGGESIHYTAYVDMQVPSSEALRRSSTSYTPKERRYFQFAPDLSHRIPGLAKELTAGVTNPYDKAVKIESWLRENLRYTTVMRSETSLDPVEEFLFVRKEGHCEYFSTAMVLLLRAAGVPARSVNGFLGGEWNSFGKYYAIRQQNAHSWVEVFFVDHGWVTFDPTPSAGATTREAGWTDKIAEWVDSMRLRWYKWVVEFDLTKQLGIFREIGNFFRGIFSSTERTKDGRIVPASPTPRIVFLTVILGGGLAWLLMRRLRAPRPVRAATKKTPLAAAEQRKATRVYATLVGRLARRGIVRRKDQTARNLIELARTASLVELPAVETITSAYEQIRFGDRVPLPGELDRLQSLAKSL